MKTQINILLFCLIGLYTSASEKRTNFKTQSSDKRTEQAKRGPFESENSEIASDCFQYKKSQIDRVELKGSIATVFYRNGSSEIVDISND